MLDSLSDHLQRRGVACSAVVVALSCLLLSCKVQMGSAPVQRVQPARAPTAASTPAAAPMASEVKRESRPSEPWANEAAQPDPEALQVFLSRMTVPAVALTQAATPPRVTALALANTARTETMGMNADGQPQTATLQEGQRATWSVTIAAGHCAAFVAQGGLGAIEVDLFLTTGPDTKILAEDTAVGPIAVIGGRGACIANRGPDALVAELHVQLRRGAGIVLIQSYRK